MLRKPVYRMVVALSSALLIGHGVISHNAIAQLDLSPSSIQLATTQHQNISKTVQISADTAIQSLQLSVSDLEKTDNADRLLASEITLAPVPSTLQANDITTVTLSIEAAALPSSGRYTGELTLSHDRSQQTVPLIIQIKDSVYIPTLVMVGGVLLGWMLSNYRAYGRPRDEIIISAGRLRTQLRSDSESTRLASQFCAQVEASLVDVETALNQRDWDAAERAITTAQKSWDRWRKGRSDWIELLKYKQMLSETATKTSMKNFPYGEHIQAQLAQFDRRLSTEDNSPEKARTQLSEIKQQIHWYLEGEALIERLYNQTNKLPKPEKKQWQTKAINQEVALQNLTPTGNKPFRATFEQWQKSVQESLNAVVAQLSATRGLQAPQTTERSGQLSVQPLPAVPFQTASIISPQTVSKANRRLKILTFATHVIAIGLLAWAGMVELYENNPTFGSSPMGDYFVLIAWGFGAEVTRESVVKAIRDLSVPIQKNKKS